MALLCKLAAGLGAHMTNNSPCMSRMSPPEENAVPAPVKTNGTCAAVIVNAVYCRQKLRPSLIFGQPIASGRLVHPPGDHAALLPLQKNPALVILFSACGFKRCL